MGKEEKTISFTLHKILSNGNDWEGFCDKCGFSLYAVNEGGGDIVEEVFVDDAKRYGLI